MTEREKTSGPTKLSVLELLSPEFQRAQTARARAAARFTAAQKNLADAEGAVRVSTLKLAEHEDDADIPQWQVAAAEEAIAKAERTVNRGRQLVVDAELELEGATALVEVMREELLAAAEATPELEPEEEPPAELVFGSTEQWVTEWLAPSYRRYITPNGAQATWCGAWWRHPEAVMRLEALWRAWEHLRLDGQTGMSVWWKDHADHHLAVMLDPAGPFKGCTLTAHNELQPALPLIAAPEGFFPDERAQTPEEETENTETKASN